MSNRVAYLSAFSTYWRVYGGWRALVLSPYLLLAGVVWVLSKPIWFDGYGGPNFWPKWVFPVIPDLLAFSLASMAIFLSISNETFLVLLRRKGAENSYLMRVVVALFHFVLVQFFALFSCLLVIAYPSIFASSIAYLIFCYALCCGLAAAAAIVDVAEVLNALGILDDDQSTPPPP